MSYALTRTMRQFLHDLAAEPTRSRESRGLMPTPGNGFYHVNRVGGPGRYAVPTAEALERRGLVETGYDASQWSVTARLTDAGRKALGL